MFRNHFRATTLLGSLLAAMVLSSLVAMGIILERFVRAELERQTGDGNKLLAASIAHEIFSFIDLHFSDLELFNSSKFRDIQGAELLRQVSPAFQNVLVTDSTGLVVQASASSGELGFDLSAREYFRVPYETREDFVSPPFISETRYSPSCVLAHPFTGGVAIAYISLDFLSEFIAGLPSSETKSISVVDKRGAFVARNGNVSSQSGDAIVTFEPWFRDHHAGAMSGRQVVTRSGGVEEFLCWATVPGISAWTVIVSEPTERVFRAVFVLRTAVVVVLVAYALFSLLLNISVIRLVRKDIQALVRFSQDLSDGKLDAVIAFQGFHDFAHLATNMELMGEAIQKRETMLRTNEQRLFDLLDFLPVPIILLTRDLGIVLMNRALSTELGWSQTEILTVDDWWLAAYPDAEFRKEVQAFWNSYIAQLFENRQPEAPFKGKLCCKDGSFRTLIGQAALIADRIVVTFVDVTQAEAVTEQIKASLTEKEVLLKEIHHRVKNNLQVVVSLLSLKASSVPDTRHLFSESIDRIQVMASIHELLYNSVDLAHINLSEYIETILHWLISTYGVGIVRPTLELNLQPVELDIDKAVPCGLIINEVITNSLKYAFRSSDVNPTIRVSTMRSPQGSIILELSDNGVGMPPNLNPETCDSLGVQLITSLCMQIRASWKIDSSSGTRWTISFEV